MQDKNSQAKSLMLNSSLAVKSRDFTGIYEYLFDSFESTTPDNTHTIPQSEMSANKETTSDSQRHIKQLWFRAKRARQCSALQLSESKRSTVHCTCRIDTLCAFICLDIYIRNIGFVLLVVLFCDPILFRDGFLL